MSSRNIVFVFLLVGSAVVLLFVGYIGTNKTEENPNLVRTNEGYRSRFVRLHKTDVRGQAFIRPGEKGFEVTVKLRNLEPGHSYNVHYHKGTCKQPGAGGQQLNSISSKKDGNGQSQSKVLYEAVNETFDHLIMIHAPNNQHILCADVPRIQRLKAIANQ